MELWRAIRERPELIWNLTSRELKAKYKGSLLGFLWSILTPLFMAAIYVFFLTLLAGRAVRLEEIIIGVFAWQFTSSCVTGGLTAITGNASLVKKVYFPRVVLPMAVTLANLTNFALSLIAQFAVLLVLALTRGVAISTAVVLVPLVIIYHTVFNFGLALLMAAANVYFRDTQHLMNVLLSAWFFLSPVMYNLAFVERGTQHWSWTLKLYVLNPMALILTAYRSLTLASSAWPQIPEMWLSVGVAALTVIGAYAIYQKAQKNFADYL